MLCVIMQGKSIVDSTLIAEKNQPVKYSVIDTDVLENISLSRLTEQDVRYKLLFIKFDMQPGRVSSR